METHNNRSFKLIDRIKHGLNWRYNSYIKPITAQSGAKLDVMWRWHRKSAGHPHRLGGPLVLSLTSYPARYGTLVYTLRSLLRQTVKADHTILWIAHNDFSSLPREVMDLQTAGLEIRKTDDIKSYKKIIPALNAFPNAFICTADDDLYYWPAWLEELIEDANADARLITCHRAHEITFGEQGEFKPYSQWVLDTRFRGDKLSLFPTGGAGALYPPGILAHDDTDLEAISNVCPYADDVWLYWIARKNGARYKTVGSWRDLITWDGSQEQALWHDNVLHGGNDEQIRRMAEIYGYPECRK